LFVSEQQRSTTHTNGRIAMDGNDRKPMDFKSLGFL